MLNETQITEKRNKEKALRLKSREETFSKGIQVKINVTRDDDKNCIANIELYNISSDEYYIQNRFLSEQYYKNVIWTYFIVQNDINIPYKGIHIKMKPAKFPEGYTPIKSKTCLTINTNLSKFFDFNYEKEFKLMYNFTVYNNTLKKKERIFLKKTLKCPTKLQENNHTSLSTVEPSPKNNTLNSPIKGEGIPEDFFKKEE